MGPTNPYTEPPGSGFIPDSLQMELSAWKDRDRSPNVDLANEGGPIRGCNPDELGVAKRVCEGSNAVPNPDELARAVAESVGKNNSTSRDQAMRLRRSALQSIQEGGSWRKELSNFIKHLNART